VVVKIEGVLIPPPAAWTRRLAGGPSDSFEAHELFPRWAEALRIEPDRLRERLVALAETSGWTLEQPLRDFLESIYRHSPLRVAYLTGGPREWARTLTEQLELADLGDLIYHYDRYPYGSRRTLLQFLMNRFIAGRARTLLIGDHPADERLADREGTRFRSPLPPPDGTRRRGRWGRDYRDLREELRRLEPDD